MTGGRLSAEQLYRACDPAALVFETTADLEDLDQFIGQSRALEAVGFGIGIRRQGYNLFALGPAGTGKQSLVRHYAEQRAATEPVPDDWCYVYHFDTGHRPNALRLPPGRGVGFVADLDRLIEDLGSAVPAAFESDEYRTRTEAIEAETEERQEQAIAEIQHRAEQKSLALFKTPAGFTIGPVRDDKPITPKEFEKLPEEDRARIEVDVEALQGDLKRTLHQMPQLQKEGHQKIERLNRDMAGSAVTHLIDALREQYRELAEVIAHLDALQADVIDNYRRFLPKDQSRVSLIGIGLSESDDAMPWFNRYRANAFLVHEADGGAPVIYEDHPTYTNLIGRIEHIARQGTLITDFTMIRAGALHRANCGYLILDALKVLSQPFAWEALKRTLKAGEVRIESLAQSMSLVSTVSLEPQPVPLDVKIILLGEPLIYYLLSYYDPEFSELFKVQADFASDMEGSPEHQALYARLIATLVRKDQLLDLDRPAVARLIEHGARVVEDCDRLSADMRRLADLLRESDYWARQRQAQTVALADVQRAIDARIRRADRLRERTQQEIQRGTLLIDTAGEKVGQINGLSVLSLGDYSFGRPTRITARVRVGDGQVVDIEREVEMGGPIHSKGVLILSNYLATRYALDYPLSLSASLAFEQSYSGVEGDSASCAELYALLSALAGAPIRQSLAVTGSVNQHGEVQAIGGVNEKIEGFFDVCAARGLDGSPGVLIPAANVQHLMLNQAVREAVEAERFAVYAVQSIDQGIELLTGLKAGRRDPDGAFPAGSINQRVEARLIAFSERIREFAAGRKGAESKPGPKV